VDDDALAREAIRDLVARYNAYGDGGRFDELLELFAPHAAMDIGRRGDLERDRREGVDAIRTIFTGVADRVQGDGPAPMAIAFVQHVTGTHLIDLVDADHATGRLYFQVLTDAGLDHWGRYADRYVRIEGRWRFEERRVTTDAFAPGSPFLGHR
jgi:hypothetical protein